MSRQLRQDITTRQSGNQSLVNLKLNRNREGLCRMSINMLRDPPYARYISFSTTRANTGTSGSVEAIHNSYHVDIGGAGNHMIEPAVAGTLNSET